MPGGRPSKYDPAYCDVAVNLGTQGKSLIQIAAHLDVARSTLDYWAEHNPEFSEALSRARVHAAAYWEEQGASGLWADKFNGGVWAKIMAARDPDNYSERKKLEHSGGVTVSLPDGVTKL